MRQIVLDTETTGLEPDLGHRIVELAAVEIHNRQVTKNHIHFYLNPDRESDPEALKVHGLDTEFLSTQPRFADVVDRFLDFVKDAEVIIHNAPFDVKFLNSELERIKQARFDNLCGKITDSLQLAREMFPGKRNNLDALCDRFGISNAHRTLHGALLDSELLGEVWLAMTRGQDSLLDDYYEHDQSLAVGSGQSIDASGLPVINLTAEQLQAHDDYLQKLDKSSGGECVWRQFKE